MGMDAEKTQDMAWKLGLSSALMVARGYPGEIQDNNSAHWIVMLICPLPVLIKKVWWARAKTEENHVVSQKDSNRVLLCEEFCLWVSDAPLLVCSIFAQVLSLFLFDHFLAVFLRICCLSILMCLLM